MKKLFIFFCFFNNLCAMMSSGKCESSFDCNQDYEEPSFLLRFRIRQIPKDQAPEPFWMIEASFEKGGDDNWFLMSKCPNRPVKIFLEEVLKFFFIDQSLFKKILQEKRLLDSEELYFLSERLKFKIVSWVFTASSQDPLLDDGSSFDSEWSSDSSTDFCPSGFFWCKLSEWCSVSDVPLDVVENTPFFKYFLHSRAREDILVRASASGLRKGCRAMGHFFNCLQSGFQLSAAAAGVISRVCNDLGSYQSE